MSHDDGDVYIEHTGSVSSFLKGVLLGAGIGILLAPRPGPETRRRLRERFDRLREEFDARVDEVQEVVAERVVELRRDAEELVGTAREQIDEQRDDLEYRVRESRAAIRAGLEAARRGRPPAGGEHGPDREAQAGRGPEATS